MFDSSEGRDPLTFLVGHRQMIPGLRKKCWGQPKVNVASLRWNERAYGSRDDDAVLEIPRENFAQLEEMSGAP